MTKVEGAQGSETLEENASKEKDLPKVQKELESTFGKSMKST
jgi:hypothetical protein